MNTRVYNIYRDSKSHFPTDVRLDFMRIYKVQLLAVNTKMFLSYIIYQVTLKLCTVKVWTPLLKTYCPSLNSLNVQVKSYVTEGSFSTLLF